MKLDLKLVMTSRCADGKNYIKNCLKNFWISISECCDQPEEAEAAVRFRLPHYGAGGALWHPGETLHLQVRIRIHQGLANNTIFVYFFMVKKYLQGKLISHWWEKAQFTTAFSSYLLVSIMGLQKVAKVKQKKTVIVTGPGVHWRSSGPPSWRAWCSTTAWRSSSGKPDRTKKWESSFSTGDFSKSFTRYPHSLHNSHTFTGLILKK